jgi:hypothetical protein
MKRLLFASALVLSSFITSCSRPTSDAGVDRLVPYKIQHWQETRVVMLDSLIDVGDKVYIDMDYWKVVDRAKPQPRIILDTVETDERGLISIQFTDAAGRHWGYDYLTLAEFNEFVNAGHVAEKK